MPNDNLGIQRLHSIISADQRLMRCLKEASQAELPNWWIVGGAVRDTVWTKVLRREHDVFIRDVDLIYFDNTNVSKETDQLLERKLKLVSGIQWSVKNQARMHYFENFIQYESVEDAVSYFPETVSCIMVKITKSNNIIILNMFGVDDLFEIVFRPTPKYENIHGMDKFISRIASKKWLEKWPEARLANKLI